VAKTRRSRKSGAPSTRARGTKKTVAKRTSAKRTTAKRAKPRARAAGLDLKKLRREIDMAVGSLSRRRAGRSSATLDEAQMVLSRWATEIDSMCAAAELGPCGPTMLMPLA